MPRLAEIENAVKALEPDDLRSFGRWFHRFEERIWDGKILRHQKDENSGIAKLARKALIEHRQHKTRPL